MKLKLKRDIVFFDVESTGLNVVRDRIVQIALIKHFNNGKPSTEMVELINPGIPISEEAMSIHGIMPSDLANKPIFSQVAQKIFDFIGNSDLAGYNLMRLDVPILMEEFARCGFNFELDGRNIIDVQRIFYRMEPRTLKAAYRYYCNQEMENAHDALSDVKATIAVLEGQLAKYEGVDLIDDNGVVIKAPVCNDPKLLHEFTNDMKMVEPTQKYRRDQNGQIVFNFGKYTGKPAAKLLYEDSQYYNWILNKEFSTQVKSITRKLVKDYKKELPKKH